MKKKWCFVLEICGFLGFLKSMTLKPVTSSKALLYSGSYIYGYFFWILSTIKMKFGQILVCCMANISNNVFGSMLDNFFHIFCRLTFRISQLLFNNGFHLYFMTYKHTANGVFEFSPSWNLSWSKVSPILISRIKVFFCDAEEKADSGVQDWGWSP